MSIVLEKKFRNILESGGIIAYPTDTAYGLGVLVNNLKAVKRLFELKERDENKAVSVVVANLKQARQIGEFDKKALKLWRDFMPGALTLVVPLNKKLARQKSWQLITGRTGKIGIRMPDHELPLKLVKLVGEPITTTSANISSKATCYSPKDIQDQFAKSELKPDLIIDGGKLRRGRISTVVDLTQPDIKILREGSINTKKILKTLKQIA